ncbi:MAG: hypothetical protein AMXMBFR64_56210 [Myxococcales bacterium]
MLGELLSLGCALTWATGVILFKRSEAVSPASINLYKNTVTLGLLGVTMLVAGITVDTGRSSEDWARLIVSGVLGIAIADTMFFTALRRIGPGLLAITGCVYAPLVVLFSTWLLGESIGMAFLAGAALVVLGVALATWQRPGTPSPASALPRRAQLRAVGIALLAECFMAFGIVIAKPALERSNLVEVTTIRLLAGTAALLLMLAPLPNGRVLLRIFRPQPVWRTLLPATFLGTYVSMILWLGGMKYTTASVSSILSQMSVIFTLLLAHVFLGESLSQRRIVGGGAALLGTAVILLWAQ